MTFTNRFFSKLTSVVILFSLTTSSTFAQIKMNLDDQNRRIAVTGFAEMEIEPDEILYQITIKEYWLEEFQEGKKYEDYKTKVPIEGIEKEIMSQLREAGVKDDQITVQSIGNYSRPSGKEFLVSKTIDLSLKSLATIDKIAKTVSSRGVNNMNIKELKHSKMEVYRLQLKVDALKNARNVADTMLKGLGEKCDKVVYISESSNQNAPVPMREMSVRMADAGSGVPNNLRKILLREEVYAIFSIAN
jgi:uncharacterized protein YggE